MNSSVTARVAAVLTALLWAPATALAQTAWHEGFEAGEPSWRDAGGDAQYRVLQHQLIQGDSHSGNGCEWLQIEGAGGSYVYFAHEIARPRIINELAPSVWVRSNRPGLQFAVRVVLPRAVNPNSGGKVTTILTGASYTQVGAWQQLQLTDLPRMLVSQIRLLRVQYGPQVDGREAYVDAVLLNVYGGPGVTSVWIDDLDVAGHVAAEPALSREGEPANPPTAIAPRDGTVASPLVPVRLPPVQPPAARQAADPSGQGMSPVAVQAGRRHTVKLVGSELRIDNRPMFPRAVQHRGEPLAVLKNLGFNTVWLQRLPAPEVLEEADRLGLWLICPPPHSLTPMADIGPPFDPVLAWDLGNDLTEVEREATQRCADQVRTADRRGNRPMICRPRTDLRGYSRVTDLLLIDRRPLSTSLELTEYAAWIRQQPRLAKPGTPVWTTVQTQPNEALRQQLAALDPRTPPPLSVPPEQIRLLAYTAVASGSRGLLFLSDSPLDTPDPDTRQRAMALELLNSELKVIEPWAAAGSFVAATEKSSAPEVLGVVLYTQRARLLLPIWLAPQAQYVPPQSAANTLSLVVPAPESTNAYELTPGGVQPLPQPKRVTRGMQVVLDEFGLTAEVLLAHDPSIVGAVDGRSAEVGRRVVQLHRDLARRKLETVQAVAGQLAARTPVAAAAGWLDAARKHLQTCDTQLASGDARQAALSAERATRSLRLVERAYWDAAVRPAAGKGLVSPVTSPAMVSFDTLPLHWRFYDRLQAGRLGPNRIAGGDFENMDTMIRAGWQYLPHSAPGVQTVAPSVNLTPVAARGGRLGLSLAATATDPQHPPAVVETPPVLFTSPAVPVEAGQIVCIHGWVQVPAPIAGSTDGLLIVDSLSGEALADRIGPTDWRQFVLYRVAPQSGAMCVTFALTGLGEARLDDVAIQVLEGPAALTQR